MTRAAQVKGHPIHPMPIPYPFARLSSGTAFDIAAPAMRRREWLLPVGGGLGGELVCHEHVAVVDERGGGGADLASGSRVEANRRVTFGRPENGGA